MRSCRSTNTSEALTFLIKLPKIQKAILLSRQWLQPDEINPLFLWFRDKSWEKPYVREHDPLFKFYILAAFAILVSTGVILLLTEKQYRKRLFTMILYRYEMDVFSPSCSPHIPLWFEYTVLFVFLILLLPCLWVSYIWDQVRGVTMDENDIFIFITPCT